MGQNKTPLLYYKKIKNTVVPFNNEMIENYSLIYFKNLNMNKISSYIPICKLSFRNVKNACNSKIKNV